VVLDDKCEISAPHHPSVLENLSQRDSKELTSLAREGWGRLPGGTPEKKIIGQESPERPLGRKE